MSSPSESNASEKFCDVQEVLSLLTLFYGAVGNPPTVEGSLAMMAAALAARGSLPSIKAALDACMTETYPVRLPHVLAKLPGTETGDINGEKRLAWETVDRFVNKWVRWGEDYQHAYIEKGAPQLSQRIQDAVRRSGGWSVYLRMTDKDFPFVQQRFFDEYESWVEVEQFKIGDLARLLETPAVKQLATAKPEEPRSPAPGIPVTPHVIRPMYEPPTREQLRDRAEEQKHRLAEWQRNHPRDPAAESPQRETLE
jgi:hypothetical protein